MKKMVLTSISVVVISVGGLLAIDHFKESSQKIVLNQKNVSKQNKIVPRIVNSEAKTDGFGSFEELEKASTIIVKGIKMKELSTEIQKSDIDNAIISGYTVTDFKINEVIKNTDNIPKILAGESIKIGELAYENKDTIYTVNGYEAMNEGDEYLLFLEEDHGLFATKGVIFGKVPLETTDLEIYNTEDTYTGEATDISVDEELMTDVFSDAKEYYDEQGE